MSNSHGISKDPSGTTLKPNLPHILALDPGGTTGYTWLIGPDNLSQAHVEGDNHHLALYQLLRRAMACAKIFDAPLHVVCEAFEFRQTERHRDFINYIPREYIGVAKLFCQINRDVNLFMQTAAMAKGFFSDDKVKKLGLWVPGKKHAMDATRHYLYHRVFTLGDKSLLLQLR